ncbi:Xaa-Pro dipeptidyl-peptidase [Umezawaea sp. Da 62-37]|uniref:Xaa-Pro dipeptidyl-peptidase n=1 Tax=Umezawaea sp. Da 62-37 TaxID=3075927 RepID=UPI0028F6C9AD|nr:Xaa-Pro dipeptidyl-peptidase [Umezawaea sp. Da 62-37]WNV82853.1 Xaa-Pro dipeptidyl-peptidase [Umezawaea sp. Da 62-37]
MARRASFAGVVAGVLGLLAGVTPATAAPQAFAVRDGVTQPVFPLAEAVRETVYVDIGMDLDGDGATDRVTADIIRPATTGRVPVIMDASPYYQTAGRGNEGELKTYDSAGAAVRFPLFYDNYFVPRGYAVVLVDFAGTSRSRGCLDTGGRAEVASGKSVVDWLNGRAAGYTAVTGGTPVTAGWSTGATGMIGKSWDGTITQGVAATGVEGLRTIVPIAAISSWYDWFRSDGVAFSGFGSPTSLASGHENANARAKCGAVRTEMTNGSPSNGDMTPMWAQRDFVRNAGNVKASVFAVHGQADMNVKTLNYGQWWNALPAGTPRKLWLSQTGHVDPFDFRRGEWVDTLHRWFDRYLLDIPNGIDTEPRASIERSPDNWTQDATWPPAGTAPRTLYPTAAGALGTAASTGSAAFTDTGRDTANTWIASPDTTSAGRALFRTGALAADLRLSGISTLTVKASPSTTTAHLSAVLVDYGPATIRSGEGIRTLGTESCWGESRTGDDACYFDTATTSTSVSAEIISRGWADLANHNSLSTPSALVAGTKYTMTFRLSTTDHVVKQGHRLGLVVGGTDSGQISAPSRLPRVTLDLAGTSVRLPVVGALPRASAERTVGPVTALAPVTTGRLDG